jgi:hypothetical protein
MSKRRVLGSSLSSLMRRPALAAESVRALMSVRRRARPWPSSDYLGWRLHTAYGDGQTALEMNDFIHYLEWRRRMRMMGRWDLWT